MEGQQYPAEGVVGGLIVRNRVYQRGFESFERGTGAVWSVMRMKGGYGMN